jgi:hypothetical protein
MFIALDVLVAPERLAQPSPCSPQIVGFSNLIDYFSLLTQDADAKQARDLVNVLIESKQKIDPRLEEMARYSGGGGGGRGRGGWGRGRGGGRGGGKYLYFLTLLNAANCISGYSGSNTAPLGRSARW